MSLCIALGGKVVVLAVSAFTLSWTHSVEKTEWAEAWAVTGAGLVVAEARVEGSGAGVDPPEGAVFDGSGWVWRPASSPQARVVLADSGTTRPWTLCTASGCIALGAGGGAPVVLSVCR